MDYSKYIPLGKNLIIEIPDKTTASGIIITNSELSEIAMVKAIGDEVTKVKVGDEVIYNQFSGTLIDKDKHVRIIEEKDLFVIVKR